MASFIAHQTCLIRVVAYGIAVGGLLGGIRSSSAQLAVPATRPAAATARIHQFSLEEAGDLEYVERAAATSAK